MNFKDTYNLWKEKCSPEEIAELEAIKDDEGEQKRRFSSCITFGTGGLRGLMQTGFNAINVRTVALATQAICEIIRDNGRSNDGIVIAYDSRNNSRIFAEKTASIAAANGVKTYLFESLRPTPELSFAIRELGCVAGVNITASHNPKEYNGYKVYWDDGGQLPPEHANTVAKKMSEIDIFDGITDCDFDEAVNDGRITFIGEDVDEVYMANVLAERIYPEAVSEAADGLKIVYTPLHGTGAKFVPEVLKRSGIKHVYLVEEQMQPDGDFPTVKKPNPESADVFDLGIKLANEVGSDLIIATDPDADRVGAMIRAKDGSFTTITGNQMGAMLLEYILCAYEETNTMPKGPYAVKTIVTTPLAYSICKDHNIKLFDVLTGFKFIGEVIKQEELSGNGNTFVFGFEESYGYLKGTYARDKDSIVASMLIAEMTAFYRLKGMTLSDVLDDLFKRYGYYLERTEDIAMPGSDAAEKMSALMQTLRAQPPKEIAGRKTVHVSDFLNKTSTDLITGKVETTTLPVSDVLYFVLDSGSIIVIRPSGTEPKVKIYYLLNAPDKQSAFEELEACKKGFGELISR